MPIGIRAKQGLTGQGLTRRQLLVRTASTAAVAALGSVAKPYLSRAADRPQIAGGIASGDVSADSAVIWATRRSGCAHAGGMLDRRKLQVHHARRVVRSAARTMTSPRSSCSKACHQGKIFSTGCDLLISARPALSAKRRSGISAPRRWRDSVGIVCLVRRHGRPGLGHRSRPRRHADLQNHARKPPGLLHSFRRSHLCRLSDRGRIEAAGWRGVAQHRHRRQIRRRPQPRAISRQLQIQFAR